MTGFLKKYKLFITIALITMIFLPFTIYKPAETDRVAVVTSIGIDKNGEDIELSLNVITPSSQGATSGGSVGSVKTFAAIGKNLSTAISKISLSVGKSVGLAHCDAVVVSKDIVEEDITKVLDYFIRSNNLTSNAIIFITEGKAKDVIKASAQETSRFALTFSDIISFNKMFAFGDSINIDNFYINYFSDSGVSILPVISTGPEDESAPDDQSGNSGDGNTQNASGDSGSSQSEGEQQGGQSGGQSGGGDSPEPSQGGGGQGGGQSQGGQSQDVIKNEGKIVVVKKGKYVCELNEKQVAAINLINSRSLKGNITAKNVNSDIFKNADITYQVYTKKVKTNCYFIENTPVFNFDLDLILQIKEIIMEDYEIDSINGTTAYLNGEVTKAIKKTIHENLSELINLAKKEKVDYLKVYKNFNKFDTFKWEKYIDSLDDKENYLDNVIFTVNIIAQGKL